MKTEKILRNTPDTTKLSKYLMDLKRIEDISFIVDQLLESKVGKFDWYKGDEGQAILKIKELIDNCQSN